MFPSQNRSLLGERNASSSALSHGPSECSYLLLAPSFQSFQGKRKSIGERLTGSISRVTAGQDTDFHVREEGAVGAEAGDIGGVAGAVDEVVAEAGSGAGWETGHVLGEDRGGCDCESGDDGGVMHFESLEGWFVVLWF